MGSNTHIIHRVNLEIEVPEMRLANQVKDDAVRLLYNEILPKLEKYMDTLVSVDEHFQYNQLNININNISEEHFEEEFTQLIEKAFHEKTKKIGEPLQLAKKQAGDVEKEEVTNYTREQMTFESFLFFLETGRLPWWSEKTGELIREQNLTSMLSSPPSEFGDRLFSLLIENNIALERLLNQFSLQFILRIIFKIIHESARVQADFTRDEISQRIISLLLDSVERKKSEGYPVSETHQVLFKRIIRQIIVQKGVISKLQLKSIFDEFSTESAIMDFKDQVEFRLLPDEITLETNSFHTKNQQIPYFPEKEKVAEIIQKEIGKKAVKTEFKIDEIASKGIEKKEKKEEGIFLDHAGLVLLHPFFDSFFKDFKLLKDGQFKDSESQTLAVHLLHYLATKQEFAAEYELIFEKFLCGWDLDLPIARDVTLSQEMKDESENLLKAAIGHWRALKNTSPDGLREGFLQREGKLILNDFQDRLVIENKAQDVLLSYLPWGFSILKLPWKERILYVEWI